MHACRFALMQDLPTTQQHSTASSLLQQLEPSPLLDSACACSHAILCISNITNHSSTHSQPHIIADLGYWVNSLKIFVFISSIFKFFFFFFNYDFAPYIKFSGCLRSACLGVGLRGLKMLLTVKKYI